MKMKKRMMRKRIMKKKMLWKETEVWICWIWGAWDWVVHLEEVEMSYRMMCLELLLLLQRFACQRYAPLKNPVESKSKQDSTKKIPLLKWNLNLSTSAATPP